MRKVCFILAVLSSSMVLADEMPQAKSEVKQASLEKTVVVEQPLHRHPTLLAMLRRSNQIRRNVGLRPQRINPALTKAAQDHANYMASTGSFSHYTNGGYQYRAHKFGFRGGVRENIASGFRTVDDAFNTWQGSGGHYASIVSGTSEAGFGYAVGQNGATYWVGVYGSPAEGDPAGEDEGFAEREIERLKAEKAKAAAEAKPETERAKEASSEKTPASSGL